MGPEPPSLIASTARQSSQAARIGSGAQLQSWIQRLRRMRRPDIAKWRQWEPVPTSRSRLSATPTLMSRAAPASTSTATCTNGIASLCSMFKRGYVGICLRMSVAHLHRYVGEFTGRHNIKPLDTGGQTGTE